MIGWMILGVQLAGWIFGSRLAMRARMGKLTCTDPHYRLEYLSNCRRTHSARCAQPLGAERERDLRDMVISLAVGLAWPVLVLARVFAGTAPLTNAEWDRRAKEQERRIAEQQTEIARLTREIGAGS